MGMEGLGMKNVVKVPHVIFEPTTYVVVVEFLKRSGGSNGSGDQSIWLLRWDELRLL